MSRRNLGARLGVKRYASGNEYWVIRLYEQGEKREFGTGIPVGGEKDNGRPEEDPQAALSAFIAGRAPVLSGPRRAAEITIDEVLNIYAQKFIPANRRAARSASALEVLRPEGGDAAPANARSGARVAYAIDALLKFWGGRPLSAVRGETCRRYLAFRAGEGVRDSTVRRELGALSAAVSHCRKEGYIMEAPEVWLPPKPGAKDRWLTRGEAARLLRAMRTTRARPWGVLFILIGLYTGTRKEAILALQWEPNPQGGWIDLENGLLYRSAQREIQTKKRKPPCPLPAYLWRMCRYARRRTRKYVIEQKVKNPATGRVEPAPVGDIKKAFEGAAIKAGFRERCIDPETGAPAFETRKDPETGARVPVCRTDPETGERVPAPKYRATITPHVLRHTCATWQMQAGTD
ncbi:MAG: tyrosine-type recombinase/integrase, partial [Alphaproteobacteria bacterium]